MARRLGTVLFLLALSFGCRKKETPPPVVADAPPKVIRLEQPVIVQSDPVERSGPDQAGAATDDQTGTRIAAEPKGAGAPPAAVEATTRRRKLAQDAAEQQAAPAKATERTHRDASGKPRAPRANRRQPDRSPGIAVAAAHEPVPAAPPETTTAHAILKFKNEAGGDFRLVDARFLLDGADLPTAITSAERGKSYLVFSGDVGAGRHMVTARLTYQGATHGVFSYMNGYSFKVRSDEVLTTPAGQPRTFTVICKERNGFNAPFEKRLVISLEGHGPGNTAP